MNIKQFTTLLKKQNRQKKRFIQGMIMMIFLTQLISCQTLPKEIVDLEWTLFPDPNINGESVVTYDDTTKTVKMPLWYWKNITEYVVDTETNIEILEKLKR